MAPPIRRATTWHSAPLIRFVQSITLRVNSSGCRPLSFTRQSHSNSHYSAPCVARSGGDRLHSRSNSNFFDNAFLSSRNAYSRPRGQDHFERAATTTGSGSRQLRSAPSNSRRSPVNLLSQLGQADSQPVDSISHPARLLHQVHASPADHTSWLRSSADHRPLNSHPEVEGQTRHQVGSGLLSGLLQSSFLSRSATVVPAPSSTCAN